MKKKKLYVLKDEMFCLWSDIFFTDVIMNTIPQLEVYLLDIVKIKVLMYMEWDDLFVAKVITKYGIGYIHVPTQPKQKDY